jgi:diacylglycerol kinase family enzyme
MTEPLVKPRARAKTSTGADRQKVAAIVFNPIKVDLEVLRSAVKRAESAAGWGKTLWFETSEEDAGETVTRQAVERHADVVVAAGGDGTVRAVAEALRGTGIALALLPSGTGNLLARNLELALDDMDLSLTSAFGGQDRKIDIGVIEIERKGGEREELAFLVMAGAGLDAKMVANTNPTLKKHVGWLAYVHAISKALRDKDELHLKYQFDKGPTRSIRAHTLLVGNCGTLPANMMLLPDAQLDDGMFDIVFLRPTGFVGWIQIWVRVAWENGIIRRTKAGRRLMGETKEIRALQYDTTKSATARFSRAEEIELDGDGFGEAIGFTAWVDPLALTVRVPASDDSSEEGDRE